MPDNRSMMFHPSEPLALLVAGEGGWALPRHDTDEAPAIRQLVRERYGLDASLLGTAGGRYLDAERDEATAVFALEVHGVPGTLPPGARWIGRADLARLPLVDEGQRPIIEQWLREREDGATPPKRVAWARPGWLDTAAVWICAELDRLGYMSIGPIEQVRIRPWSAVLRITTGAGAVYFKAVTPSAAFEVPLTQALAGMLPAQTPNVLAADTERHWLLMADAGTSLAPALRAGGDPAPYAAALGEFARYQLATVPYVGRLVALGCPDRRLERLPALFARTVADRDTLLVGRIGGFSESDYARLRAITPEVERLCARLASYHMPTAALHHDEITPGHVIPAHDGGYIFFDWGDCGVTHPLCSLMMVLRWARLVSRYDDQALASLRDAYLAPWAAYEPLERAREAYALAGRLALLCRALTWYDLIPTMEPGARWEFDDSAAYFLGLFANGED